MRGFTLVELAIVLVVIGLLVGGVLVGQSLIREAELRAVAKEYTGFVTAIHAFRDKYSSLPGDMPNATNFWGQSSTCPGTYTEGSTDGTTCNGNNDGQVFYTGSHINPTRNEVFRFWQHLSNAGMIAGNYNGVTAATNGYYLAADRANSPTSKLGTNIVWTPGYLPNHNGTLLGNMFRYNFLLGFFLGGIKPNTLGNDFILMPIEAYNIDLKLDDGMPGRGVVTSNVAGGCNNAASNQDYDATYTRTNQVKYCWMVMKYQ